MNITSRQSLGKLTYYPLLVFIYLLTSITAGAVESPENGKTTEQTGAPVELNFEITKSDYEYQIENRSDPFVPFYTGETDTEPTLDPNEIIDTGEQLTGMQLFEPGQLTLRALLQAKGRYFAMVEDFTGRGYIIKVGMKIGRRGFVKAIEPNKVLIEEVAVTRAGKELRSEIVMALRKEGEE